MNARKKKIGKSEAGGIVFKALLVLVALVAVAAMLLQFSMEKGALTVKFNPKGSALFTGVSNIYKAFSDEVEDGRKKLEKQADKIKSEGDDKKKKAQEKIKKAADKIEQVKPVDEITEDDQEKLQEFFEKND